MEYSLQAAIMSALVRVETAAAEIGIHPRYFLKIAKEAGIQLATINKRFLVTTQNIEDLKRYLARRRKVKTDKSRHA